MKGSAARELLRDRWRLSSILLLVTLAGVMLATVLDYGMTGDEGVQHRYGRRVLRWYATLGADRAAVADVDVSRYGGLFEIVAGVAEGFSPLDAYETRHVVTVLFAFVAFLAVYGMGRRLGGELGGFLSLLFLALCPPFYGHSFNNPKDIPFAAMFALATNAVVRAGEGRTRPTWPEVVGAGVAIGLAAGTRVAGIVLFGYALVLWAGVRYVESRTSLAPAGPRARELWRLGAAWSLLVAVGWTVMLALWPWAVTDPLLNPLRSGGTFSRFWDTMIVFYDGRLVAASEASRFYLPNWFALTLPEIYPVAFLLGALGLAAFIRTRPLDLAARVKLLRMAWLIALAGAPVAWVVLDRTPLYDGLRHFLFVMPILAVLAGVSVASFFRDRRRSAATWVGGALLGAACLVTLADMIALHPYQAVYFNRLVAGGVRWGIAGYEGDYWCLSYKEGTEWLLHRYARATCRDKVRVAGHSILLQTSYYLNKTEEGKSFFKAVALNGDPHFVLATTRYGDHLRTPGRLVHVVAREGASILYVFELEAPTCDGPVGGFGDRPSS